jgi:hypothetical protein
MLITYNLSLKAVLMGACDVPPVGENLSSLPYSDLTWMDSFADYADREWLTGGLPLWAAASSGNGDGDIDGVGDGYGAVYPHGAGYGAGYSDGNGDCYGVDYSDDNGDCKITEFFETYGDKSNA